MSISIRHAALRVSNLEEANDFYQKVLGLRVYYPADKDWGMLESAGSTLSLVSQAADHPGHIGLNVASKEEVDAFYRRMVEIGYPTGKPALHRDGSYGFYFKDPSGNALEIIFIPRQPFISVLDDSQRQNEINILLVHGSNDPEWYQTFETLMEKADLNSRNKLWFVADMAGLASMGRSLIEDHPNAKQIIVHPFFWSSGKHLKTDIPAIMHELEKEYPGVEWLLQPAAGQNELVQEALVSYLLRL